MTKREEYLEYYVRTETQMHQFNSVKMTKFFGENIARLRSEHGFSQEELAKMTGVSKSTIVRIELNTVQHIDMIVALKLSSFFHVPLMKLVDVNHDLIDLYSSLIQSTARTKRLVNNILAADVQNNQLCDYDPEDKISKICFSELVHDGINSSRFLFETDNISEFRDRVWYQEACCILEINSNFYHPLYLCGDRLVISDRAPINGEIGIFLKNKQLYIRRFVEEHEHCYLEKMWRMKDALPDLVIDRHRKEDMSEYVKFGTVVAIL